MPSAMFLVNCVLGAASGILLGIGVYDITGGLAKIRREPHRRSGPDQLFVGAVFALFGAVGFWWAVLRNLS